MVERVLVVGPKDTISMVDDLAPKGFEIVKALHNSPEQKAALPGADYFVGFVQQYVNPQLFKDAPKLKLIQLLSAGYDRADIPAAIKAKVPMCNNGGANSVAVSEHALLLMLSVSRRLITQHANVTAGRWHGNSPPTVHRGARQGAGHHRPRHDRQEGRAARPGLRHERALLRHRPPQGGAGRRARRALPPAARDPAPRPTSSRCTCR